MKQPQKEKYSLLILIIHFLGRIKKIYQKKWNCCNFLFSARSKCGYRSSNHHKNQNLSMKWRLLPPKNFWWTLLRQFSRLLGGGIPQRNSPPSQRSEGRFFDLGGTWEAQWGALGPFFPYANRDKVRPSETKWYNVRPSQTKWNQVIPKCWFLYEFGLPWEMTACHYRHSA